MDTDKVGWTKYRASTTVASPEIVHALYVLHVIAT